MTAEEILLEILNRLDKLIESVEKAMYEDDDEDLE